jgi:hypothetical protein
MRLFLRRAALTLATGSLVFFLSCERHHVGELPVEQQAPAPAEKQETKSEQPAAATPHSHTSQSVEPRNTPANFFPDKPKP